VRERTKVPGRKEWEQIVEVVEFERPRRFGLHIVEGGFPGGGWWTFERDGDATRVHFEALVQLRGPLKLLQPVMKVAMARSFAKYHRNLRRNVEVLSTPRPESDSSRRQRAPAPAPLGPA